MAPLADAVRFVDGDQWAIEPADQTAKPREREPLRRDVDEGKFAPRHPRHAAPHLHRVEGRREIRRPHAAGFERLDLIGHQRHERRHDQGRAGQDGRRKLIAEALATAGRRHEQQAPVGEQRLDGLALAGTKCGVAQSFQGGVEIAHAL